MIKWLRGLFGGSQTEKVGVKTLAVEQTLPIEPGVTYLTNGRNFVCTYCGGIDFYDGPSGGLSINKMCANDECRHRFNHTPMLNRVEDLHRRID